MKLFLLVIFTCVNYCCHAQVIDAFIDEFQIYYPEILLYKKIGVKAEIDTAKKPYQRREFDKLGRLIAKYGIGENSRTIYSYIRKGDTLIRYEYFSEKGKAKSLHRFDIFIYNASGKIKAYQSCSPGREAYTTKTDCRTDTLEYNSQGNLVSKRSYFSKNYNTSFSANLRISDSVLGLTDIWIYKHDTTNNVS